MNYQKIQEQIVSRFWSEGLKAELARRDYVFAPEKLMCLAYKHNRNYTERLKLMRLFADQVPEAAEHAKLVIQWMERCLAAFRESDENIVFEVWMDSDGTDNSIRYLCTTFDACPDVIEQHYAKNTWDKETENACYTIVKRRILQPGDSIDRYEEQYADLGPGKVIADVPTGRTCEYGDCEGDCTDCPHICVDCCQDLIPEWIPDLSPVRYRNHAKEVRYGCVLSGGCDSWEAYIIPLDSGMFDDGLEAHCGFFDHEHIIWPDVDVIKPEELPAELRQNYDAFVAFWKALYPEKYAQ